MCKFLCRMNEKTGSISSASGLSNLENLIAATYVTQGTQRNVEAYAMGWLIINPRWISRL